MEILNYIYLSFWAIAVLGTFILLVKASGRIARDLWGSEELSFVKYFPFLHKIPIIKKDKFQHFAGGFILGMMFGIKGAEFAAFWEVKDAVIPYEKLSGQWKKWGGDGFSWKDLVSTLAGVILGTFISITLGIRKNVIY